MITPDFCFFSAPLRLCGSPIGTGTSAEISKAPPSFPSSNHGKSCNELQQSQSGFAAMGKIKKIFGF
jgi:hypothetical protein